jgi:SanA protein
MISWFRARRYIFSLQLALRALSWWFWLVMGMLLVVLICNLKLVNEAKPYSYFSIDSLPTRNAALVLGTSKGLMGGGDNLYFKYRMEATSRLFKTGKVKYLILSGNNDSEYYNEPKDMQKALLALGVPFDAMILDFSGKRTYDSILRAKYLFKETSLTIISQNFHTARALYIAHEEQLDAVAFAAQDVPDGYSYYTLVREYFARVKAILDVHVWRPNANITQNEEKRRV